MRPLRGVVTDVVASILTIKLESGRHIEMPQKHGIEKWDAVLVPWDLTINKPVRVYKHNPAEITEPVMEEPEPEDEVQSEEEMVEDEEMDPPDSDWETAILNSGFWGSPTVF